MELDLKEVLERLVWLEAKAERLEDLCERIDGLTTQVQSLSNTLSNQRTFIGGVIFTVSALWALFTFVFGYFRTP